LPALIVSALALLFVAWLLGEPLLSERRRAKLRRLPFPAAWRRILNRTRGYYPNLREILRIGFSTT